MSNVSATIGLALLAPSLPVRDRLHAASFPTFTVRSAPQLFKRDLSILNGYSSKNLAWSFGLIKITLSKSCSIVAPFRNSS